MDETHQIDERLLTLYQSNAVVGTALRLWRHGSISYEEALILCVVNLAKENEHLTAVVTKLIEQSPNPIEVSLTKDQLEQLKERLDE